jgi:hypothetical protein
MEEAERRRSEARGLFEQLGAVNWIREFDEAWAEGE